MSMQRSRSCARGKTEAERKAGAREDQDIWRTDMPTPVYDAIPEMIACRRSCTVSR